VKLVGACDHRRTQQGQRGIQQEPGPGKAHPQSAQPQQTHRSVANKMAGFANVVMQDCPAVVGDLTEDVLPNPAQRTAGLIGPENGR